MLTFLLLIINYEMTTHVIKTPLCYTFNQNHLLNNEYISPALFITF